MLFRNMSPPVLDTPNQENQKNPRKATNSWKNKQIQEQQGNHIKNSEIHENHWNPRKGAKSKKNKQIQNPESEGQIYSAAF